MDDMDRTTERQEQLDSLELASVSSEAKKMSPGHEGECDKCGEWSPRLMGASFFESKGIWRIAAMIDNGICPPCRDKRRLP